MVKNPRIEYFDGAGKEIRTPDPFMHEVCLGRNFTLRNEQFFAFVRRYRSREEISLAVVATNTPQQFGLLLVFYAFGDAAHVH